MTTAAPASAGRIGALACLAFAVGTMVGGGVFTLSGTALNNAGPSALVSYGLAALLMLLSALSFVAVAARARAGDSGYGAISDLLGPAWRFLAMWGFYINGLTMLTFLAVSFGQYLNEYFISGLSPTDAAIIAAVAVALLNLGPSALVGRAETWIVVTKVALLAVFIGVGLMNIGDASFKPFAPNGEGEMFSTAALLFTAYTGFNVVTNMSGSLDDPARTVPFAVIGSIIISGLIYGGVVLAMLASGVEHFGPAGVGEAAQALMGSEGAYLIAFAACLSTLSGANANVLGTSEMAVRMVAQGDIPPGLGRLSPSGHPYSSIVFLTLITVILVMVSNVDNIVAYANVSALTAMVVVNLAALRLAVEGWPGVGLRLPGGVLLPALGALTCLAQLPSLGWGRVAIGLALLGFGLVLYMARHHRGFGARLDEDARGVLQRLDSPLGVAMRHAHPGKVF